MVHSNTECLLCLFALTTTLAHSQLCCATCHYSVQRQF